MLFSNGSNCSMESRSPISSCLSVGACLLLCDPAVQGLAGPTSINNMADMGGKSLDGKIAQGMAGGKSI